MSETPQAPEAPQAPETPQGGESPEEKGILRDLQAERAKRQALRADYDALVSANEEAAKKQLEDQEKYKELYEAEQLKTAELSPIVDQHREMIEARKSVLLEKLGDDADDFKGLDVPALEKVVDKLTKLNPPPSEPGKPGRTPSGKFGGYDTLDDLSIAVAAKKPGAREAWDNYKAGGGV